MPRQGRLLLEHGQEGGALNDQQYCRFLRGRVGGARQPIEEGDLAKGVVLTVSGEPSADPDEKLLKVERLWIDGVQYDLYPGRD